jgi:Complex 1 protein (LYR family)
MSERPSMLTQSVSLLLLQARRKVGEIFRKNQHVKDHEVTELLVAKGYMELEETVMQYKQKTHLLKLLGGEPVPYRPPKQAPSRETQRQLPSFSPNKPH